MKNGGGKGKAYLFIAQNSRYLIDCGAKSDVFSARAGTLNIQYEHSMYSMISLFRRGSPREQA
jgi:hypothetical protein